jgi:hypothetical protein
MAGKKYHERQNLLEQTEKQLKPNNARVIRLSIRSSLDKSDAMIHCAPVPITSSTNPSS